MGQKQTNGDYSEILSDAELTQVDFFNKEYAVFKNFKEELKIDIFVIIRNQETNQNEQNNPFLSFNYDLEFKIVQNPDVLHTSAMEKVITNIKLIMCENRSQIPFTLEIMGMMEKVNLDTILDYWKTEMPITEMLKSENWENKPFFLALAAVIPHSHQSNPKGISLSFKENTLVSFQNYFLYHHIQGVEYAKEMAVKNAHSIFLSKKLILMDFFTSVKHDKTKIYLPIQSKLFKILSQDLGCFNFISGLLPGSKPPLASNDFNLPKLNIKEETDQCSFVSISYSIMSPCMAQVANDKIIDPESKIPCLAMPKNTYLSMIKKIFDFYHLDNIIPCITKDQLQYNIIIEPLFKELLKNEFLKKIDDPQKFDDVQFYLGCLSLEIEGQVKIDQ